MVFVSTNMTEIALIKNNMIALKFDKTGRYLGADLPMSNEFVPNAKRVHVLSFAYSSTTDDYEIAVEFANKEVVQRFGSTVNIYTAMELVRNKGCIEYMLSRNVEIDKTKCMQVLFLYNTAITEEGILNMIKEIGGRELV